MNTTTITQSIAGHLEALAAARLREITDRAARNLAGAPVTSSAVRLFASDSREAAADAYAIAQRDIRCHDEWAFDVEHIDEQWALVARRPMYEIRAYQAQRPGSGWVRVDPSNILGDRVPASHAYIVQGISGGVLPQDVNESRICTFCADGTSARHTVTRVK